MSAPASPPEFRSLCEISARIGSNPLLVQGAGGNTSVKSGDRLWVKASGTWLSDATTRNIFLPLPLSESRAALASDDESALARLADGASDLKPSIETLLHALMPQHAVIHAHAVNSMVTSVLADGRARAASRLDRIARWAWVGYERPGKPLAHAVARALEGGADVLLLQNHGVVVGGASIEDAERLLLDVEDALRFPVRSLPQPDAQEMARAASERYEALPAMSGVALDPALAGIFSTVCFIPDQVVFLGGPIPLGAEHETAESAAARVRGAIGMTPPLVFVAGAGAYGARDRSPGAESLIGALLEIGRRLPPQAEVVGLSTDQMGALRGWDAEVHRQRLDRERG